MTRTNQPDSQTSLLTVTMLAALALMILISGYIWGPTVWEACFPSAQTLPSTYYLNDDVQFYSASQSQNATTSSDTTQSDDPDLEAIVQPKKGTSCVEEVGESPAMEKK